MEEGGFAAFEKPPLDCGELLPVDYIAHFTWQSRYSRLVSVPDSYEPALSSLYTLRSFSLVSSLCLQNFLPSDRCLIGVNTESVPYVFSL